MITATGRARQIDVGIEAIGTAGANESVDVTSKTSNIVTAVRFCDGQAGQRRPGAGGTGSRADLGRPCRGQCRLRREPEPGQPQPRPA